MTRRLGRDGDAEVVLARPTLKDEHEHLDTSKRQTPVPSLLKDELVLLLAHSPPS